MIVPQVSMAKAHRRRMIPHRRARAGVHCRAAWRCVLMKASRIRIGSPFCRHRSTNCRSPGDISAPGRMLAGVMRQQGEVNPAALQIRNADEGEHVEGGPRFRRGSLASCGLPLDHVGHHLPAEQHERNAAAGMRRAADEEDVSRSRRAQRRTEKRGAHGMRGPAVKRAVMGEIARGEIGGREDALGHDARRQIVEAKSFEPRQHEITISRAFRPSSTVDWGRARAH